MSGSKWHSSLGLVLVWSLCLVARVWATPEAGRSWLAAQFQVDGRYAAATALATPFQATAEVLRTWQALDVPLSPEHQTARAFVTAETFQNTAYLARQIRLRLDAGQDVSTLRQRLLTHANADGGFGDQPGYASTVFDTAWALVALAAVDPDALEVVGRAVAFLQGAQSPDGGFRMPEAPQLSVPLTALAALALQAWRWQFDLRATLEAALTALVQQQRPGGGWESAWETALALEALVQASSDASRYAAAVSVLHATQAQDGSWEHDVYSTALVLRALQAVAQVHLPTPTTTGTVSGRLVSAATGLALPEGMVTLEGSPVSTTVQPADGTFVLTAVLPGTYSLRAQSAGYQEAQLQVSVGAGQQRDVGTLRLVPRPDVGLIMGLVTASPQGLPLAGVAIRVQGVYNATTSTTSDGRFQLVSPPGPVTVSATTVGYQSASGTGTVPAGGVLRFAPALVPLGAALPTAMVQGQVVAAGSEIPLGGAVVRGGGRSTTTSADGYFRLSGVTPEEGLYIVTASGYQEVQLTVLVPAGSVTDLGVLRLAAMADRLTVRGSVADAGTGLPIARARISAEEDGLTTMSDSTGRYTLAGIPRTQVTLSLSAVGYLSLRQTMVAAAYGTVTVQTRLQSAQQGTVTIVEVSTEETTTYAAQSEVEVQVVLANQGSAEALVRLTVAVLDASGTLVEQYPALGLPTGAGPRADVLTVAAHDTLVTEVPWRTGSRPPGAYQVIVQAHDPSTARLLSERGLVLTVTPTLAVGGGVHLTPPITHLAAQTPIAIQAQVANRGNQLLDTALTATVTLTQAGYTSTQGSMEVTALVSGQGLNQPRGLVRDAAGTMYVANYGDHTVRTVSPQGVISTVATGLSNPVDVALGPQGDLYILNQHNSFVRLTSTGTRTQISTGIRDQNGLTVLADSRVLLATDTGLYEVSPTGTVRLLVGNGLVAPEGVAVDRHGTVFIADSGGHRLLRLANGALAPFVTGITNPYGLAIDASDTLYVTSFASNSVLRVTPQGTVSTLATGLAGPQDIKLLPNGDLVVVNSNSHSLVTISPTGTVTTLVPSTLHTPQAAAYGPTGTLYIGNSGSGTVVQSTPAGVVTPLASGLAPQALLAEASGNILVLESDRLRQLTAPGQVSTLASGLRSATSLVAAADGQGVLVSEGVFAHRIRRVATSGQITPYLEAHFGSPRTLRVTETGTLLILSSDGYVSTVTPQGTVQRLASGVGNPQGLARAADGTVYVSDATSRRVLAIAPDGAVRVAVSLAFVPGPIALTAQEELLVASFGSTLLYRVNGAEVTEYGRFAAPITADLVVASDGAVWMTSPPSQVSRLAPDGRRTDFSLFALSPNGLAPDQSGGVYLGTSGGIRHLDRAGVVTPIATSGLQSRGIVGVGVAPDGRFWALDGTGLLFAIAPTGTILAAYSTLSAPRGLAYRGADLFIANGNNTVLRMRAPEQLLEVVVEGNYSRIAVESGGTLLLETATGVKRFDLASGTLTDFLTGWSNLTALAVAPTGTVAVTDSSRNELGLYQADGRLIDRLVGLVRPRAVALERSGQLLVGNSLPDGIVRVLPDGRVLPFVTRSGVTAIAVEADDSLTVSRGSTIETLSASGEVLRSVPSVDARGLVRTAQGTLLVASAREGALFAYGADGSSHKVASGLSLPTDVITSPAGVVHVVDRHRGVVQAVHGFNTTALVADALPNATTLAFDDTTLYVAYDMNKLAVFTAAGERTDVLGVPVLLNALYGLAVETGTGFATAASDASLYRLRFHVPATTPQTGDVVYSATRALPLLVPGAPAVPVDFGTFIPPTSGDFTVTLVPTAPQVSGHLATTLHVGAQATSLLTLAQSQVGPGDQAVAAQWHLVGADPTSVTTIDPQGTTLAVLSQTVGRAVAADSSGNIYAADPNRIKKITPTGQVSIFVTGLTIGSGLAVDNHDHLYAISGRTVLQITPAGTVRTFATLNGTVSAVVADLQGRLYTIDSSNTLSRLDSEGRVTPITTLGLHDPQGLTIDVFGRFYVLNANSLMVRISPDGTTVAPYFHEALFEFEGVNMTADCADNLLFAPLELAPLKARSEEDRIVQLVGATKTVRQVLYGPSIYNDLDDIDVLFYDRLGQRLLIWTERSGGKIFALPVTCGGLEVTAHLVTRADVDLRSADPAPTRLLPRADGTQEAVWVLPKVDQRGSTMQLNLLFRDLHEGEQRAAFHEAFLEWRNSFVPGETVRVPLAIPSVLTTSAMALSVQLDEGHYGPGETAQITATVRNQSARPFDGTLALRIVDAAGSLVATLPTLQVPTLAGFAARSVVSTWLTGTTFAGHYTVQGQLRDHAERDVAASSAAFTLGTTVPGSPILAATIIPDRQEYAGWDTGTLAIQLRNLSANTLTPSTTLVVTVTTPGAQVLLRETRLLGESLPGTLQEVTLPFTLVDQASGTYAVALTVQDTASGAAVATASTTFLVEHTGLQGLTGLVPPRPTSVSVGQALPCTVQLTNHGSAPITDLQGQWLVVQLDTQQILSATPTRLTLVAQSTQTLTHSVATATLPPGPYACVLQVTETGPWSTLGAAVFQLEPRRNQRPVANAGLARRAFVGDTVPFDGSGSTDPDQDPLTYTWTLSRAPAGSRATLEQPTSATPRLLVDHKGTYDLTLVVHDGTEASTPATVTLTVGNRPPVADAGRVQHAATGTTVTLHGQQSFDPDGDLLTYAWSVEWSTTATPATSHLTDAQLLGRTTPSPTFVPDVDGSYVAQLTVNDAEVDSAPALVTVIATTPNVPPNADAGRDRSALVGVLVPLDGRASTDTDRGPQPLTFAWSVATVPPGSALQDADLRTPAQAQASFVPDVPGVYGLTLLVSDGQAQATDTVLVTAARDVPPNARAGADQTVELGQEVQLDGSASDDPDQVPQPLTHAWRLVSLPPGSALTNAALRQAQTASARFTPDVPGSYVLELAVSDGLETALDRVLITVQPRPRTWRDVSALVQASVANERSVIDRRTGQMTSTVDITLTNTSTTAIAVPIHAVFVMSAPGVSMPEASGVNAQGLFFYDLAAKLGLQALTPGQSATFTVRFVRPLTVRFTYNIRTFGMVP